MRRFALITLLALLQTLLLAACGDTPTPTPMNDTTTGAADISAEIPPTATLIPPTATIPPTPTPQLAALVNGQTILLTDFERELGRYEKAHADLGQTLPDNHPQIVLDALIERELMAQAAAAQGISISAEAIDSRLADLQTSVGGDANFNAWLDANQYTLAEFRTALHTEMLTEQVVGAVTADVPTIAEQLRARIIQVDDATLAQSLLDQLRSGADFSFLAQQHSVDRVTAQNGGDIGFFASGSLLVPEVETAAFSLETDAISDLISVTNADSGAATYYIVQTVERDPNRALPADLRYNLLQQSFEIWLQQLLEQAAITRFV